MIDEVFTEGWFNYFHTTYGVDDMNFNEKMMGDIEKKLEQLKEQITGCLTEGERT